ncbi:response regulator [Aliiglaciecola sp. CAU 1673]|uniref:response regulator n=1 Tax=Aliiglaciecola sp. CAU 1673 TaxID=3032595 RepID=UPI0023DB5678|nr:response regulator [Aliiglaciecola sp. CAU 1673]MDF2176724.1 response regulator [Aliiglaciecola sp. CAU 1673]
MKKRKILLEILLMALAYFIAARLSLFLSIPPGYSTAIWPAAGVAVAGVIARGTHLCIGVFLGSLAINLFISWQNIASDIDGMTFVLAGGIAIGSSIQAWIARLLITGRRNHHIIQLWDTVFLLKLIVFGGLVSSLVSASNGHLFLYAMNIVPQEQLFWSWLTWWAGDSLGVFVFAPLLLLVFSRGFFGLREKLITTCSFLLLLAALVSLYQTDLRSAEEELDRLLTQRTQNLKQNLESQLSVYTDVLVALKAYFDAEQTVSREAFAKFTSITLEHHQFIKALSWIPAVPADERLAWEELARQEVPQFHFKNRVDGELRISPQKDIYYPVYFIEPQATNQAALGFDLYSEPDRRATIQRAIETEQAAATPPLQLVQSDRQESSFIIYLPLQPGTRPDLVSGVFLLDPIFADITNILDPSRVGFRVTDSESQDNLFAWPADIAGREFEQLAFKQRVELTIAQREWQIQTWLQAPYVFDFFFSRLWLTLSAGMGLVGLLVAYMINLASRALHVEKEVRARTIELNDSQTFLRSILDNLPLMVFVKDADSLKFVELNKQGETLLGLTPSQYKGKQAVDLFSNAEAKAAEETDQQALTTNNIVDIPKESLKTPQGMRYLHTRKTTVRDSAGHARYILGISEDITKELKRKQELEEKTVNLEAICKTFDDMYFWIDNLGTIEDYRAAEQNLLNCSANDINRKPIDAIFPASMVRQIKNAIISLQQDPKLICQVECELTDADGAQRYLEARLANIPRDRILMIIRDISTRKAVEEALRKTSQYKSDFLANMSHEIRTPMNAILGLTQLVLNTPLDPQQLSYLKRVQGSSQALLNILNDILDYSKIEANKLELYESDFDIEDVLRGCTNLFSLKAEEKQIELIVDSQPNLTRYYHGDSLRISQILTNLLSNAIKFTEQGYVRIGIKEKVDGDNIALGINVSDTGIGMTEGTVRKLFQPFEQADSSITRQFGGTGLGLTVSKHLATLMGGDIDVRSKLNQGSVFTLDLPLSAAKHPIEGDKHNIQPLRTLIVDDLPEYRDLLVNMLKSMHFQTQVAASGEEAMAAIIQAEKANTPFELLLLDWKLPDIEGLELGRQILAQKAHQQAKLIMMTAFGKESARAAAKELPSCLILEKPILISQMQNALYELQSGQISTSTSGTSDLKEVRAMLKPVQGARILLVEDNPVNQIVGHDMLVALGLTAEVAQNGAEAVEQFAQADFDLILMDLQMPVMDGFDATRTIRATDKGKDIPILAMTAAAMLSDKKQTEACGMNGHISKPIDVVKLADELLRWLPHNDNAAENKLSETSEEAFSLPGFDLEAAAQRLGGNWTLLRKLLQRFAEDLHNTKETLTSGQADAEETIRQLHTLKGSAATIGAMTLADQAAEAEGKLKAEGIWRLESVIAQLDKTAAVVALLGTEKTTSATAPTRPLRDVINEVRTLLRTAQIVDETLKSELVEALQASFKEQAALLKEQLDNFQYQEALVQLETILQGLSDNQ